MGIRKSTFLLLVLSFMSLVAVLYGFSRHIFLDDFRALETRDLEKDLSRLRMALRSSIDVLGSLNVDWAFWDDTYEFLRRPNRRYLESNLPEETFHEQSLLMVALYDTKGRRVWGRMLSSSGKGLEMLSPEFDRILTPASPLLETASKDGTEGVAMLPSGPILVSSKPVLHSSGAGDPAGVLIMARSFANDRVHDLARRTELKINMQILRDGTIPAGFASTAATEQLDTAIRTTRDSITGTLLVRDISGRPALTLSVEKPREIYLHGANAIRYNLLTLLLTGIVFSVGTLILLERRILSRLLALNAQVKNVGNCETAPTQVSLPGNDELATLASNINQMLRRLTDKEAFLRKLLDSVCTGVMLIEARTHIIKSVNPAAAEIIGLPPEEIEGQACHNLICLHDPKDCPAHGMQRSLGTSVKTLRTAGKENVPVLNSMTTIVLDGQEHILKSFLDISELCRAQESLRLSEQTYRTLFHSTGTANILIDGDLIVLANKEFENISGYPREEIENRLSWQHFDAAEEEHPRFQMLTDGRLSNESAPLSYESRLTARSGEIREVRVTVALLPDGRRRIASIIDITEQKRTEEQLMHQTFHDRLTGLPNRALLLDRLNHAIGSATPEMPGVGVLMLDVDRFKKVNDSCGHVFGDKLLQLVAHRIQGRLRKKDTLARPGGDEFMILASEIQDEKALALLADDILRSFARPFHLDEREIHLGVSIGIAAYPADGKSAETLVKNAEMAMYRSKEIGRGCFSFYTDDLNREVLQRLTIEQELRRAIQNDELDVHFQPIAAAGSGRVEAVEALVRWPKADGGMVSPSAFIPVAEETDLILTLDLWVLKNACRRIRALHEEGVADLVLSVNFSARHFQHAYFAKAVKAMLDIANFPPQALRIEITETAIMENLETATRTLEEFREMGAGIALDDFGTGYSSLHYLQKLDIQTLKIDRSFVSSLGRKEPGSRRLVLSMLTLAENMGLSVVAEGVETKEQWGFFREHGCDYIQGFYFSRPLTEGGLRTLLKGEGRLHGNMEQAGWTARQRPA